LDSECNFYKLFFCVLTQFVPSQYSQYVNYTTIGVSAEIIINNGGATFDHLE